MVVGEVAVRFAVEVRDLAAEAAQELRRIEPAGAVAGIADDLRSARPQRDLGDQHVDVFCVDVSERKPARFRSRLHSVLVDDAVDLLNVVAPERGLLPGHLEPVELLGVVAAGDHDAAVGLKPVKAPVKGRRGAEPQVRHADPRLHHAGRGGGFNTPGGQARVAAQRGLRYAARCQPGAVGLPDQSHVFVGELLFGQPPDVVLAKNMSRYFCHAKTSVLMSPDTIIV